MQLVYERDMEYPRQVRVSRPSGSYDEAGRYMEGNVTVIERMAVDIQLSLRVRQFDSKSGTGVSDNAVWVMYCMPPVPILAGDRVHDGERVFAVEAVGDWGSHMECLMQQE